MAAKKKPKTIDWKKLARRSASEIVDQLDAAIDVPSETLELDPRLLALLDHDDAIVRARAALLAVRTRGGDPVPAIERRWKAEDVPGARASFALALGQRGVVRDGDPLSRGLFLVGARTIGTDDEMRDFFVALARELRDEQSFDRLAIETFPAEKERLARAMSRALSIDLGLESHKGPRVDWPNWILETFFRERALEDTDWKFDALQRELLENLSKWPNEGLYERYGLPSDIRSRRRVLGMDLPSIIDSVWRIFPELSKLQPSERLDAWMESCAGAYGTNGDTDDLMQLLQGSEEEERTAFVERWVPRIRACPWHGELDVCSSVVLWAWLRDHDSIPPEFDDIVTFYGTSELEEVLRAIPEKRREAIAMRAIERHSPIASRIKKFAALMPKAAKVYAKREEEEFG